MLTRVDWTFSWKSCDLEIQSLGCSCCIKKDMTEEEEKERII